MAEEQPPAAATPASADTPPAQPAADAVAAANAATAALAETSPTDQAAIDELLQQASFDDPSALGGASPVADAEHFPLPLEHATFQLEPPGHAEHEPHLHA